MIAKHHAPTAVKEVFGFGNAARGKGVHSPSRCNFAERDRLVTVAESRIGITIVFVPTDFELCLVTLDGKSRMPKPCQSSVDSRIGTILAGEPLSKLLSVQPDFVESIVQTVGRH